MIKSIYNYFEFKSDWWLVRCRFWRNICTNYDAKAAILSLFKNNIKTQCSDTKNKSVNCERTITAFAVPVTYRIIAYFKFKRAHMAEWHEYRFYIKVSSAEIIRKYFAPNPNSFSISSANSSSSKKASIKISQSKSHSFCAISSILRTYWRVANTHNELINGIFVSCFAPWIAIFLLPQRLVNSIFRCVPCQRTVMRRSHISFCIFWKISITSESAWTLTLSFYFVF